MHFCSLFFLFKYCTSMSDNNVLGYGSIWIILSTPAIAQYVILSISVHLCRRSVLCFVLLSGELQKVHPLPFQSVVHVLVHRDHLLYRGCLVDGALHTRCPLHTMALCAQLLCIADQKWCVPVCASVCVCFKWDQQKGFSVPSSSPIHLWMPSPSLTVITPSS